MLQKPFRGSFEYGGLKINIDSGEHPEKALSDMTDAELEEVQNNMLEGLKAIKDELDHRKGKL